MVNYNFDKNITTFHRNLEKCKIHKQFLKVMKVSKIYHFKWNQKASKSWNHKFILLKNSILLYSQLTTELIIPNFHSTISTIMNFLTKNKITSHIKKYYIFYINIYLFCKTVSPYYSYLVIYEIALFSFTSDRDKFIILLLMMMKIVQVS